MLVVGDPEPGASGGEAPDGVTPPMRSVRGRLFRKQYDVDPELVSKVEFNLLTILAVSARVCSFRLFFTVHHPTAIVAGIARGGAAALQCRRAVWVQGAPAGQRPLPPGPLCRSHAGPMGSPMQGGAPEGMKFVDYEEEYRINEATGQGEWVPVAKR